MMKLFLLIGATLTLTACNKKMTPIVNNTTTPLPEKLFVIQSAVVDTNAIGANYAKRNPLLNLLLPSAIAQAQGSGVVSVTYSNPSVTSFTLNTSQFMGGAFPTSDGETLQMGNISVATLDDNTLRVCTGVGAPANKCNRLYIRVFTLGSNISGSITNVAGFINTDASYGIDVKAGSVTTPIGFNSNSLAASVTNAATVFTYTIPNNLNRVRLTNTGSILFPITADLSNAGNGNYEMRLVVQYALGYVP